MTTFDAPRDQAAPPPPPSPGPTRPGGGRGRPGAPHGAGALFDERGFEWPAPPGKAKREAKLPWFHFHDADEARAYLRAVAVVESLGLILFINWLFFKNQTLSTLLFPVLVTAQVVFRRTWVRLCKRANPPLGKRHWLMTGWASLPQRQCVSQARAMLRER